MTHLMGMVDWLWRLNKKDEDEQIDIVPED